MQRTSTLGARGDRAAGARPARLLGCAAASAAGWPSGVACRGARGVRHPRGRAGAGGGLARAGQRAASAGPPGARAGLAGSAADSAAMRRWMAASAASRRSRSAASSARSPAWLAASCARAWRGAPALARRAAAGRLVRGGGARAPRPAPTRGRAPPGAPCAPRRLSARGPRRRAGRPATRAAPLELGGARGGLRALLRGRLQRRVQALADARERRLRCLRAPPRPPIRQLHCAAARQRGAGAAHPSRRPARPGAAPAAPARARAARRPHRRPPWRRARRPRARAALRPACGAAREPARGRAAGRARRAGTHLARGRVQPGAAGAQQLAQALVRLGQPGLQRADLRGGARARGRTRRPPRAAGPRTAGRADLRVAAPRGARVQALGGADVRRGGRAHLLHLQAQRLRARAPRRGRQPSPLRRAAAPRGRARAWPRPWQLTTPAGVARQPSCAPNARPPSRCGAPGSRAACSQCPPALPQRGRRECRGAEPCSSGDSPARAPERAEADAVAVSRDQEHGLRRVVRQAQRACAVAAGRQARAPRRCKAAGPPGAPPSLAAWRSGSATARSSQPRRLRSAVTSSPAGVKKTTTWRRPGLSRAPRRARGSVRWRGRPGPAPCPPPAGARAGSRCRPHCRGCRARPTRHWSARTGCTRCQAWPGPGAASATRPAPSRVATPALRPPPPRAACRGQPGSPMLCASGAAGRCERWGTRLEAVRR